MSEETRLYVSPKIYVADSKIHGRGVFASEDILPDDIFEAGTTLTVTIPINKQTICEQDIKITFSENDDNPLIFENIDFCTLDKMILIFVVSVQTRH